MNADSPKHTLPAKHFQRSVATITAGIRTELSEELFRNFLSYRYKVFIEMLGWRLPTQNGVELDQFDRPDTLYVIAQDEEGSVNGCARLLPTDRPYLLGEVFPQILNGLSIPRTPDVWELSRFAAVDFKSRPSLPLDQFTSATAIELLHESIKCAGENGAKRLIAISHFEIEWLLRRTGFQGCRAGPAHNNR